MLNKEYTVTINSVSSDGNGVAHIGGMAVFVPFTAPDDEVKIRITEMKKRFARGEVIEIVTPSPDRTDNGCPYFEECGGCNLRHIKYEKQLDIKKSIVENAVRRIGGFRGFKIEEIIGPEAPERYRNKTVFHSDKGRIGFYSPKSHTVIPVSDCLIGAAENAEITKALSDFHGIKQIFTRKSFATGEVMVSLTAEHTDGKSLTDALINACEKIAGIFLNGKKVAGAETISDILCGISFDISPESFFQINPVQTEKLYAKAIEYAELNRNTEVMDIYCGIGTISLCAAKSAKSVIGVEYVEEAVRNAKRNAEKNGITNVEFYSGSAEKLVPRLVDGGEKPDTVILDPPRAGSDEKTLGAILKAAPKRIVYVSCNPATLARDLRFLADNGNYTIKRAAAVDMFPHTNHVETVVVMEKQII